MKTKTLYLVLLFILFGSVGCEKFLKEDIYSSITPGNFFKTEDDLKQALVGCYEILGAPGTTYRWYYTFNFIALTEYPSDVVCAERTGSAARKSLDQYTFASDDFHMQQIWSACYTGIARANALIKYAPNVQMNEATRNSLIGEAKFLRALHYFNLVRFFGDIPLVTDIVANANEALLPRTPKAEVFDQIIEDLKFAEENIIRNVAASNEYGKVGKVAAKLMLADVYQNRAGNDYASTYWEKAATKASEVMSMYDAFYGGTGDVKLMDSVSCWGAGGLWEWANRNCKEFIFQRQATATYNSTIIQPFFFLHSQDQPEFWGVGTFTIEPAFYLQFDSVKPNYDKRRDLLTNKYKAILPQNAGKIFLAKFPGPLKYWEKTNTASSENFSNPYPIYRYAEALLIYAESLNEWKTNPSTAYGTTGTAYDAANRIRARAGLPPLSGLTRENFRKAVWKERHLEFFIEGKRLFDLRRTKTLVEVMNNSDRNGGFNYKKRDYSGNPISKLGRVLDDHFLVFPIPSSEVASNPNMTQNSGY